MSSKKNRYGFTLAENEEIKKASMIVYTDLGIFEFG